MEGNLRFKIDWASLMVGSKFTVFAWFYFVFEGTFPSTSSWGTYIILEGWLNGGFFALLVWGTCIWRGLCMDGLIFGILRHGFHSGGGQIRKWNVPFYRKLKHRSTPIGWSLTLDYCGKYLPGISVTCGDHSLLHFKEYWLSTKTKYCDILSRVSH